MEMQDMLADRLKQKRALSHASLEEYSKELGISKSALQKYEAGTGNPTLATVQTIADHLHESPAQLLGMYSEEEMEAAGPWSGPWGFRRGAAGSWRCCSGN